MKSTLKSICLAAAMLAVALTFSASYANAQEIYPVDGGRTTVTIAPEFITTLATLKITPAAVTDSQLYDGRIFFPISSGALSLDSARGQILHAGGISLIAGASTVHIYSLVINTLNDDEFVSGLVVADGRFLGRVKLFNVELPSDLKLPLDPKDGDFFISDVKLTLAGDAATALNDAFNINGFAAGQTFGHSLSVLFVPLTADGH
jgi:hypothetical protein